MVKKKKEEDEYMYDEDDVDTNEDDYDIDDSKESADFDEDLPTDSLGLATQISKESDTALAFKELPKEVRYSFYDKNDKNEIKHFARAYRTHQYIEKVIDLRMQEDIKMAETRLKINTIIDKKTLKEYFNSIGRGYLLSDVDDLNSFDLKKIYDYVKTIKPNYLMRTIQDEKERVSKLYDDYNEVNEIPSFIDDMGNIGKIVDTSVSSMGFKGNASQHSIMTIQAVKNEDIQSKAESKRSFGFMDAIKNKIG